MQDAHDKTTDKLARVAVPALAALCLVPQVTTGMGLVAGIVVALTLGNPWAKHTKKLTAPLLQGSVVGLGFGMDLGVVLQAGLQGLSATAVGIVACMVVGLGLGALLGVARDVGLLVTVGTAICGGSAIAAVVPVLRAKEHDATVALAVVFLLNALGLLIFPALGHHFALDEHRFGLWAALAIHDTSSVVGASSLYGPVALQTATTVKLARALWIVPLAFAVGLWSSRARARTEASRSASDAPAGRPAVKLPWFILGFLAAAAFASTVPGMHELGALLARISRQALVLTLFLIGSHITRASLRAVGVRPLIHGVVLWLIVAAGSLAAVVGGLVR